MAMETKPPQTEITFGENKENPFHNDLLNRKQEIMDLTPMIKRIKSPAVMALYAPWGAGKTAFIKMWAAYLNKEQIPATPVIPAPALSPVILAPATQGRESNITPPPLAAVKGAKAPLLL